jgi:hypothetical protein
MTSIPTGNSFYGYGKDDSEALYNYSLLYIYFSFENSCKTTHVHRKRISFCRTSKGLFHLFWSFKYGENNEQIGSLCHPDSVRQE